MIEQFYVNNREKHINSIRRALRYNKHLAEDIVQEAYLKAFTFFDQYDEKKGTMNAWFNRILYNELSRAQKENANLVHLNDNIRVDEDSIEYLIILDKEIRSIPNKQHRIVVDLRYRVGYEAKEIISYVKGLTITNINTICNRFRQQLKDKYRIEV